MPFFPPSLLGQNIFWLALLCVTVVVALTDVSQDIWGALSRDGETLERGALLHVSLEMIDKPFGVDTPLP